MNQPIENRFPHFVAGEVVIGDEEAVKTLRNVGSHDCFDVVRRAEPRLSSLHVYDRAKRALVRTPASGIETGHSPSGTFGTHRRNYRDGSAFDSGQIAHEVVDRFELT